VATPGPSRPPPPRGQVRFHDSVSETPANGNVLGSAPVTPATYGGTVIYDVDSNVWEAGADPGQQ